jgi:hypothetical protein
MSNLKDVFKYYSVVSRAFGGVKPVFSVFTGQVHSVHSLFVESEHGFLFLESSTYKRFKKSRFTLNRTGFLDTQVLDLQGFFLLYISIIIIMFIEIEKRERQAFLRLDIVKVRYYSVVFGRAFLQVAYFSVPMNISDFSLAEPITICPKPCSVHREPVHSL